MQRILVVDDEVLVAYTIAIIFRSHGFDVRTAYSAAEGLSCARTFQPDLLVCDIGMPGRSGLGLMHDISNELPRCRVIVLTAQHSNRAAVVDQSGKMPHPATFLTKPCHPLDLLHEAGAVLAGA